MPNGNALINELTYKAQIKAMPNRALQEFTAEKIFELVTGEVTQNERLTTLEGQNKKMFGLTGGVSGLIGAGIVAALNWVFGAK